MTFIAFPGHAGRCWPLARWRSLARIRNMVNHAIATVDDPEYPGISIVDLGLVADVRIDGSAVEVDLVPTFSGCPALAMIAADVAAALDAVDGVEEVTVRFVAAPAWTPERITPAARRTMAASLGVAVAAPGRAPACPRCGAVALVEQSMFGPVRCRSIQRCRACGEVVEAFR